MIYLVEVPHFVKVRSGEAGNTWEFKLKVHGQVLHHAAPPGLSRLALDNKAADVPVEVDELPVHSTESCILGCSDSLFDFAQQCPVRIRGKGAARICQSHVDFSRRPTLLFHVGGYTLQPADLPSNQFTRPVPGGHSPPPSNSAAIPGSAR